MPPSLPRPHSPQDQPAAAFHQAFGPGEGHPASWQEAASFVFDFAQDGGSWVDPLFRGLPPVQGLPSLGERYQDLEFLGEGATAKVFKAMDSLLLRHVALKVLKDPAAPVLVEGRAQARIEHPNVCRIYEVGHGYLVMELIEGTTLQRLSPALDLPGKVRLVRDVALGAHAAHQRDLVHLDLKLGNVLVRSSEDGTHHPLISDFGMVLGKAGPGTPLCPMGTPPFSSPEQLFGDPAHVDRRSDIYSLGVMLYVLLSGESPFPGRDTKALLEAIAQEEPVALRTRVPRVPADLAGIVGRCLEKNPEQRYPTALHLAQDLDRFLQEEAVAAMRPSWIYVFRKWVMRNRRLAAIGAICAALLLATGVVAVRHARFIVEQEEWDHHFQVLLEDLRSRLDRVYRKPIHDVEPEFAEARAVLPQIEQEMGRSRAAYGPGHLALGQALLLLEGRNGQALQHLQKAWDGGFRTEGARAWLACVLVNRYQQSQTRYSRWTPSILTEPTPPPRPDPQLLQRARQLLAGRRNTEHLRIAHLLELASLGVSEEDKGDRALAVARTFRKQFPDDIDGMLEETQALVDQATCLWKRLATSGEGLAERERRVAPLLDQAGRILLDAMGLAPSHPGVYRRLGKLHLIRSECADHRSPNAQRQLETARIWTKECLRITPKDSVVFAEYVDLVGAFRPGDSGAAGMAMEARQWKALQDEWPKSISRTNPMALEIVLGGMVKFLQVAEGSNGTARRRIAWILRSLDGSAAFGRWPSNRKRFVAFYLPSLGELLLACGEDPGTIRSVEPLDSSIPWESRLQFLLTQAEYLRLAHRDAMPTIRAVEAIFSSRSTKSGIDPLFDLQIRTARARCNGSEEDWDGLRALLKDVQKGPDPSRTILTLAVADALLSLGRHEQRDLRASSPSLVHAREVLLAPDSPLSRIPSPYVHGQRSELLLLEGRSMPRSGNANRTLLEGLEEASLALRPLPDQPAWMEGDPTLRSIAKVPVRRARILGIKAELCLAMGEGALASSARRSWGRKSLEAVAEARRISPLEAGTLAPLEQRARSLGGT